MRQHGVRFIPMFGRQSYVLNGKHHFYGGVNIEAVGGGWGLVDAEVKIAERLGIEIRYGTGMRTLLQDRRGAVTGVQVFGPEGYDEIHGKSVVLACGGFESNPEMRTRYLGPNWDLAKVRGTKYNNGVGHRMAIDIGAAVAGHWSGAHAVQWDMNAPPYGDLTVGDRFQKHNYPFGVLVNARGERFLDEGLDFHSYTYAKYGHEVMKQPGLFAWQIFDQKIVHLLREEYRIARITKEQANTLEELAPKLAGVDAKAVLETLHAYNAAPRPDVTFNPNIHDGLRTFGLPVDKTNWAQKLDAPPYHAYGVTAGVTFTFGGLKANTSAEVEDITGVPIPGLYAAGEILGGLYFHNYGSGTGLVAGVVFGRIAGRGAAGFAAQSA
jgi:tricarballylate dehydrogenase